MDENKETQAQAQPETQPSSSAIKQVNQGFTVWRPMTSAWSGTERLTADDLGKDPNELPDIFSLGRKSLIPEEWKNKLAAPRRQVKQLFTRIGNKFIFAGAFTVQNKNFLLAKQGLEQIQENMNAIVEDFIAALPDIQAEMIEKYPALENADWPTPEQIRRAFKLKYNVFQVGELNIQEVDSEELAEAKRQAQQELQATMEEYKETLLEDAKRAIVEACQSINEKIMNTDSRVTEATLKKPRKVIEDYFALAEAFDLTDVKEHIQQMQEKLDGVTAKGIREDWELAQDLANTLRESAEAIGDISGLRSDGTVRRRVLDDTDEGGAVSQEASQGATETTFDQVPDFSESVADTEPEEEEAQAA